MQQVHATFASKEKPTDHCPATKRNKYYTGKSNCLICKQDLYDETKVRDHCHLNG